ncbi:MAG: hypothetical protein GY832_26940 [Chloroflexi bacterium]|nr:hypothetical protein [Chloroflexota bacterium]
MELVIEPIAAELDPVRAAPDSGRNVAAFLKGLADLSSRGADIRAVKTIRMNLLKGENK